MEGGVGRWRPFMNGSVPVSNLLDILKGLLNLRLKVTDNYIITTFG